VAARFVNLFPLFRLDTVRSESHSDANLRDPEVRKCIGGHLSVICRSFEAGATVLRSAGRQGPRAGGVDLRSWGAPRITPSSGGHTRPGRLVDGNLRIGILPQGEEFFIRSSAAAVSPAICWARASCSRQGSVTVRPTRPG